MDTQKIFTIPNEKATFVQLLRQGYDERMPINNFTVAGLGLFQR